MNENIAPYIIKEINEIPMVLNRHLRSIHNIKYHKRDDFYNLKLRMDNFIEKKSDKRFFIMPGLRGVGKTTLLFQVL